MKVFKSLCIGLIICLAIISCNKDEDPDNIVITGMLKTQGITTYQYGSHTMSGYALTSNTVKLDDYVDQNVTVVGYKIEGYPVDGGPDYIEVEEVR